MVLFASRGRHRFVIRELAGQFAAGEQAGAELKEEMALVLAKFHKRVVAGFRREPLHFVHGFLRDKHARLGR